MAERYIPLIEFNLQFWLREAKKKSKKKNAKKKK
jgi:hypothetical protein